MQLYCSGARREEERAADTHSPEGSGAYRSGRGTPGLFKPEYLVRLDKLSLISALIWKRV